MRANNAAKAPSEPSNRIIHLVYELRARKLSPNNYDYCVHHYKRPFICEYAKNVNGTKINDYYYYS